jgi:hypothetical protein
MWYEIKIVSDVNIAWFGLCALLVTVSNLLAISDYQMYRKTRTIIPNLAIKFNKLGEKLSLSL